MRYFNLLFALISPFALSEDLNTDPSFFEKPQPAVSQTPDQAPLVKPTPVPTVSPTAKPPAVRVEPQLQEPLELEPAAAPAPQADPNQLPIPDIRNYTLEPKFIEHPLSKKGLVKIDSDRTYIYDIKKSDQTRAVSVRFALFTPKQLRNSSTGVSFTDLYTVGSVPMLLVDYEWMLWRTFGKLYFTLGSGIFTGSGHGRFETETYFTPKETFTFAVFPINVGVAWRIQFFERQIFVPYLAGGGTLFPFAEIRDDGTKPKFGMAYGAYSGAGLQINANFMDTKSMADLDREYGINDVYFTGEFRLYQGNPNKFDFSGTAINFGILMEF